jgi:hypothetical protein
MKSRILIFLGISAILTASFTFVSISDDRNVENRTTVKSVQDEPAGGLLSEEKL